MAYRGRPFLPQRRSAAFVTGIPALSSGSELWIAVHNHRPEPLQLHSGQNIGVLEVVTLAESPAATSTTSSHPQKPCHPPLPERLSLLQQQQLNELFREFSDVFSRGEDDLGNTPLFACDRDSWASAPPALSPAEPRGSQRGDDAGTANAVQQCHPPLELPMGLSSGDGTEKRW